MSTRGRALFGVSVLGLLSIYDECTNVESVRTIGPNLRSIRVSVIKHVCDDDVMARGRRRRSRCTSESRLIAPKLSNKVVAV